MKCWGIVAAGHATMPVVEFTERQIHGVMLLVLVLIVTTIGALVIGQLLRTWRRYTQRHAPDHKNTAAPDAWTVAGQRMSAPSADEMDEDEDELDEDDMGPDDFHDFDDEDEEDLDDDGDDEEKDKPRKP